MKQRKPMATRNRKPSEFQEFASALLCGVVAVGAFLGAITILAWLGGGA